MKHVAPTYQHLTPQSDIDHVVKPLRRHLDRRSEPLRCEDCGRAIGEVSKDDGPESLKALLRF